MNPRVRRWAFYVAATVVVNALFITRHLVTAAVIGIICCLWEMVRIFRSQTKTNRAKWLTIAGFSAWLAEMVIVIVQEGFKSSTLSGVLFAILFPVGFILLMFGQSTTKANTAT